MSRLRDQIQRDVEIRQVDLFRAVKSLREYLARNPAAWEFVCVTDLEQDLVNLGKLLGDASAREEAREAVKAREDKMMEAA